MVKNLLLYFFLLATLSACGTYRDQYGNQMTQKDDFECKQQCGYYDMRQSPISGGYCLADCYKAKGYVLKAQ